MLEGRLITGDQREFVVKAWSGRNESGYEPLDDRVLVLMDEHASTTSGGIEIPLAAVERQTMAAETGTIVALGPGAFVYNDEVSRKWVGRRPEPGDRVYVSRYSGQLLQGIDGRTYRIMSQSCIGAVAIPEATAAMVSAEAVVPKKRRRIAA